MRISDRRKFNSPPPFDSEVEYIEVNSTNKETYIDLGIIPQDNDNDFYIKFQLLGYSTGSGWLGWMGAWQAENLATYRILALNTDQTKILCYNGYQAQRGKPAIPIVKDQPNIIELKRDFTVIVNGVQYTTDTTKAPNQNATYKIFNVNSRYTYGRLYRFKWVKGDKILIDLVPVRKGNIGYMYDRVSGKLYGGRVTQQFIVGPDV